MFSLLSYSLFVNKWRNLLILITRKKINRLDPQVHILSLSLLYPFCLYTLVLPTYNNEPAVWPDWVTFLKFLTTKFLAKDWQLWGLFWKTSFSFKNLIDYFLGNFWKNLATFYSNIWSHCYLYKNPLSTPHDWDKYFILTFHVPRIVCRLDNFAVNKFTLKQIDKVSDFFALTQAWCRVNKRLRCHAKTDTVAFENWCMRKHNSSSTK